jgi:hypothetical protein
MEMQKDASLFKESLMSAQLSFHHRSIPNNEIAASAPIGHVLFALLDVPREAGS